MGLLYNNLQPNIVQHLLSTVVNIEQYCSSLNRDIGYNNAEQYC